MRRVIIMGAGGRDFHNFNVVYRDNPDAEVVAFTATQIPGIADRRYPPELAGPRYPAGIQIRPEEDLARLIEETRADEVVFAYSDVAHVDVMHRGSMVLAAGADFSLLGARSTMLRSERPVVAVCAVRTGAGKSQTTRRVGQILLDRGLRVALVRHPMPYGDLTSMRVQRFASLADIDASHPTVEEREEYERPVELGMVMYAGVDYGEILAQAQAEADVIVWDGGNNDLPFYRPQLHIVIVDPLRAGDELAYHPGEANLRMADVIVVNKVDSAGLEATGRVLTNIAAVNPSATVIRAASPLTLQNGPSLRGLRALVVEDGPTLTHGGMSFGAATVAAQQAGVAECIDPRPYAVGTIAEVFRRFAQLDRVLPAMGYSDAQLRELEATINAAECDVVVTGTPFDLGRLIHSHHPLRHVGYELQEIGEPTLTTVLEPLIASVRR
ncbi:MAG: cyclic 2,3-diphosphoglycerate synthase [Candidatus Dormibacteria bacterium]|jgi:predicted GTPase